jgi:hypothetical protein
MGWQEPERFFSKELLDKATVTLPETYRVGVSFETDRWGEFAGVNVIVMKNNGVANIVVHSQFYKK